MSAAVINLQLVVHSTDDICQYLGPKADVDKLAKYLKVVGELPSGLNMIQIGAEAPTENLTAPWLKTDGSNNPVGLYYFNGFEWVDSSPTNSVKSTGKDRYIQSGQFTVRFYAAADKWVESSVLYKPTGVATEFKFPVPFKNIPDITFTHFKAAFFGEATSNNFECCLGTVTLTGFTIWMKYDLLVDVADARTLNLNYISIGEVETT